MADIKVYPIDARGDINGEPQMWDEEKFKKMQKHFGKNIRFKASTGKEKQTLELIQKTPVSTMNAVSKKDKPVVEEPTEEPLESTHVEVVAPTKFKQVKKQK